MKIDIEFLHGDQITSERDGSAFRPKRWEVVLSKGLNGKVAFLPFEPGELSVRQRNLRRRSLGYRSGVLMGGVDELWGLGDWED